MPDYTSRLALAKPRGGSSGSTPPETVDIDVLNTNFDVLDGAVGASVVTSTSRPTSPYLGQMIYESDSRSVLTWNGTIWDGGPKKRTMEGSTGTAVLTAATNPNTGAGGYQRMYWTVVGGFCFVEYSLYWQGSGLSAGSGSWSIVVPFVSAGDGRIMFRGNYLRATSGQNNIDLMCNLDGGTSTMSVQTQTGSSIGSGTTAVGVAGDRLLLSGKYPIVAPVAA